MIKVDINTDEKVELVARSLTIELSDGQAREVTKEYLSQIVGKGCVVEDGEILYWTRYPHGSGTTIRRGKATRYQKAAWKLLKMMLEDE